MNLPYSQLSEVEGGANLAEGETGYEHPQQKLTHALPGLAF